jgi:hypothetical protein
MRSGWFRQGLAIFAMAAMGLGGPVIATAQAQVRTVDPNDAIDADLQSGQRTRQAEPVTEAPLDQGYDYGEPDSGATSDTVYAPPPASLIEDILRKQGEPNGYIIGREASGAFVVGFRYGSGTLHHKVEGERPVYWTGPSIGFDAGANAGNTFVLVYNLYDSEDLYKRFGAGEGAAYLVGGFHTSYLRRGDVVLIPVRMGLGLRLGVNAGYMKFTRKRNFVPF